MSDERVARPWAVFAHDDYYPQGGRADCVGRFATEEGAEACKAALPRYDSTYIINLEEWIYEPD